ncbi:MAG: FKBP-type peptidyl-prolyl cis-trans isomerase [Pseudomonadota bacterium]|nr:FKBP-type peptidyl-prolyl cis-trans isomerase [Pseudomonadota bacterium]
MSRFLRSTAAAVAAATLAMGVGCKPADQADQAATTEAGADAQAGAAMKIPGLETDREQVSYMIGLQMGKSLEPIKDEVDLETLNKALRTALAGEAPLMTEEQLTQIGETFGQKMQAKQVAEMAEKARKNQEEGAKFLADNAKKPGVEATPSGLQYQVLEPGDGPKPGKDAVVRVHYKGQLLDDTTFDSSYDRNEPVVFPLTQVVAGWQEGITLMPVGSKYRFWIPSELGYGDKGTPGGPIGPNATLVFEVELLEIVEPAAS